MDTERNLKHDLERLANNGQPWGAQTVLDRAELELRGRAASWVLDSPRARWSRPVAVIFLSALVVGVSVGVSVLLTGTRDPLPPAVTESPAPPTTTVSTTQPPPSLSEITPTVPVEVEELLVPAALAPDPPDVPSASLNLAELTWSRVELPESLFTEGDYLSQIVTLDSRLVLLGMGTCGDERVAAVWTSEDGYAWSRVPHDPVFHLKPLGSPQCPKVFRDVVVGGPGLVAVGQIAGPGPTHTLKGVIWTSPDGLNWSRVSPDGPLESETESTSVYSVYRGGPGLVAIGQACELPPGQAGCERRPAIWTSQDGLTWTRIEQLGDEVASIPSWPSGTFLDTVVSNQNGFVAVGASDNGMTVWTSPDRTTWTRVPRENTSPQTCFQWLGLHLAASDSGFVATRKCNSGSSEYSTVWTSVDGRNWTSTTIGSDVVIGDIVGIGSSFLAVGSTGQVDDGSGTPANPAIWTSTDGITWVPAELDITNAGSGSISGVALGGPGLVAKGWSPEGPTIWVATP
jgi:hypothetical protein